jgi:hypothetical protein
MDFPTSDLAGLCATCAHCRIVKGARSTFYMCTLSFTDDRFPRYPPLPVRECVGYQTNASADQPDPPTPTDER